MEEKTESATLDNGVKILFGRKELGSYSFLFDAIEDRTLRLRAYSSLAYYINKADFVACHVPAYITKHFPIVRDVKPGGVFLINCQWDDAELSHHLDAASKRYIAKNNIQVYTINAIDLAKQIGMGKRTNTILQSAFFSLAKVLPETEALQYMKDAATHSYLKKGQDVVDMNHKAIDLGATAYKKFDVPADWADAKDETVTTKLTGREGVVKQVEDIMFPVGRMDGDSLPVSAFLPHVDGQFEQGAAAYEKRGVSVSVPTWDASKCIQCNNCAYVCPHATIRPFALTEEEAAKAPAAAKIVDVKAGKGKGVYKYTMAVSPLDCMGCGVCVGVCPVGALTMVGQEEEAAQQDVFDYCVAEVAPKADMQDNTVKGSQFKQPYLEFSGSCAGCAETSYARLVTQLFGDHMYISNATGCSSIWGGPAATSPYCTNKEGHGPAWCNSLFEDNAEHGLGMFVGQDKIRQDLADETRQLIAVEWARPELKAAAQAWLDTMDDGTANAEPAKAYVKALEESICTVEELARMFIEEGEAEGVRGDVAFAQSLHETGYFKFGGIVLPSQNNYAGIGALNGNAAGQAASFPDPRTGVRAQIQHLKAYASTEALVNECVDPRFSLVARGVAPYVEWLGAADNPQGRGWAVPGAGYGANIVKLLGQILAYKDPGDGSPEGTPAWQKEGFEILVKRGIINSPDVWKARFNQPIMVGEILAIIGRM